MTLTALLLSLLASLAFGLPIAYGLLASSLLVIVLFAPGVSLGMLTQTLTTANDSFPIMAVPFFILAGLIMGRGGISKRLFDTANAFVGHIPGGVGVAAVLTAMFFSAISGSGPATVAAVGGIMIPEMIRVGYSRKFSAALIAAAGTIGVVIPPSIPLVVFGVVTGTSIGDLFLAAVLPGILMGLVLIAWAIWHARTHGVGGTGRSTWKERLSALNRAKGGLLLPVIILGGIYGGIFTPTEAAVIAVVYGVVLALLVYREMRLRDLLETFVNATLTTSALMFIVAAAAIFGRILTIENAPETIVAVLTAISGNPVVIILLVNLLLLLLGTFMETIAAVTITAPILVPVLSLAGLDPVHIGVLIIVVLSFGFITPPLGVNLFIAAGVAKVRTGEAIVAVAPGFVLLVAVGLIVSFVPALSMLLVGS
jgi:C4-dicarboxylate transporter DctM subunit